MQPEPLTRGREGEREEEDWTLKPKMEAITAWGADMGEGEKLFHGELFQARGSGSEQTTSLTHTQTALTTPGEERELAPDSWVLLRLVPHFRSLGINIRRSAAACSSLRTLSDPSLPLL